MTLAAGGSILSLNIGSLNNDLETEVKILESSSILNPIFNFVKEEKKFKNRNSKIKFKMERLIISEFIGRHKCIKFKVSRYR